MPSLLLKSRLSISFRCGRPSYLSKSAEILETAKLPIAGSMMKKAVRRVQRSYRRVMLRQERYYITKISGCDEDNVWNRALDHP